MTSHAPLFTREQWSEVGSHLRNGKTASAVYRTLENEGRMPYKSLKSFINSTAHARRMGYLE